jgi:hypothetical protein
MESTLHIQFFALVGAFLVGVSLLLAAAGAREDTPRRQVIRALVEFWITSAVTLLALGLAARWGAAGRSSAGTGVTTLCLALGGWGVSRVRWLMATGLGLRPEAAPPRRFVTVVVETGVVVLIGWLALTGLNLYLKTGRP